MGLFFLLLCLAISEAARPARTAGPQAQFILDEGLTSNQSFASDSSAIGLFGQLDFLGIQGVNWDWLRNSVGVSISTNGSANSQFGLGFVPTTGYRWSLEIWLRSAQTTLFADQPIVGLSNFTSTSPVGNCPSTAAPLNSAIMTLNLGGSPPQRVFQPQLKSDETPNNCTIWGLSEGSGAPGSIIHVVMTRFTLFVNGICLTYNAGTGTCNTAFVGPYQEVSTGWNPNYKLQLAPTRGAANWNGEVFFIAYHNYSMNLANASQNYQAWLPINNPPSAITKTQSIFMDTLTVIDVEGYDLDVFAPIEPDNLTLYINSLPTQGTMFLNGVLLTSADLPAMVRHHVNITDIVTYQGPLYVFNQSFSFTYNITDGQLWGGDATLTIALLSFPFPPIPTNTSVMATRTVPQNVQLSGFSPGEGAGAMMKRINVTTLPFRGQLSLPDDPSTIIATTPFPTNNTEQQVLYNGNLIVGSEGHAIVGTDVFEFMVEDQNNPSDFPGYVSVTILNHLATVDMNQTTQEDNRSAITLEGAHASGGNFTPVVDGLPNYGCQLYPVGSATPLGTSDLNYTVTTGLEILCPQDWSGQTQFLYHIQDGTDASFYSPQGVKTVIVAPVNDPPVITVVGAENLTMYRALDTIQAVNIAYVSFNISDPDATDSNYSVSLNARITSGGNISGLANFRLSYANVTFRPGTTYDGTQTSVIEFSGTIADVRKALTNLQLIGSASGRCPDPNDATATIDCPGPGRFRAIIRDRVYFGTTTPPAGAQEVTLFVNFTVYPSSLIPNTGQLWNLSYAERIVVWCAIGVFVFLCFGLCRCCCVQYKKWHSSKYVTREDYEMGRMS
jgi:hypothetical protein